MTKPTKSQVKQIQDQFFRSTPKLIQPPDISKKSPATGVGVTPRPVPLTSIGPKVTPAIPVVGKKGK